MVGVNGSGHPSSVRQNMMGPGAAGGDQLVTDAPWKRQIGDPIAVEVAKLAAPETELDPSKTVWSYLDAVP